MEFRSPSAVAEVIYQMKYADWSRARNRAQISDLFNGLPPFTEEEVLQNRLDTNVNDLSAMNIAMAARGQLVNALVTPDPLVDIQLDYGPVWKRREWANIISRELNKKLKNSAEWMEEEESTIATLILHGIAPAVWQDRETPYCQPKGVEDVLVPGNTYRSLTNLPFYAVFEQYTGAQLYKLTHGKNVDKAWNMPLIESLIQWVDQESKRLMGSGWPEAWSPEKWAERAKEDAGLFASDALPTIDTYHLYYWSDEGKTSGWRKKVILDAWANPGFGGTSYASKPKGLDRSKHNKLGWGEFLYDPEKRVYADKLSETIAFQFGDASSVAPFRYHSVRSMGFLLYAVCHLQNRLKCRFSDTVFENLMQYFRVANPTDMERVTEIDLINRKVIPEGVNFMPQNERWQVNESLIQMGMQVNRQVMSDNSASFTQDMNLGREGEETATLTMAKVNSTSQLVGAMIGRAYNYQKFKQIEVCRRFCLKNSKNADVMSFRVECLKAGVPEDALHVERWNVSPVRVIGNGNKMLQMAMSDKLMAQYYDKVDPDAQKDFVRLGVAVTTGDWSLANRAVPETRPISDAVHDTQNGFATLMLGIPLAMKDGINHQDVIETDLHAMATVIAGIEKSGGMATAQQIAGLQNVAQYVSAHIKKLSEDKAMKSRVKIYGDDLSKLMNLVKAYAQRLQEQSQKQNGNGQPDPKDMAKIKATLMMARTKSKISSEAHGQRTAERQISLQQKLRESAEKHRADIAAKDLEAATSIRRGRLQSFNGE